MDESFLEEDTAGVLLLRVDAVCFRQAEATDEPGEGETLQDKGGDDEAKGEIDDHAALGEGFAVGQGVRKGDGGGEGQDAAHAAPAEDEDAAGIGTFGFDFVEDAVEGVGDVGFTEDPGHADADEDDAEADAVEEQGAVADGSNFADDKGELEAEEDKNDAVEDEGKGLPDG